MVDEYKKNDSLKGNLFEISTPKDISSLVENLLNNGIKSMALLSSPSNINRNVHYAYSPKGLIQTASKNIRETIGKKPIIYSDVCVCQFNDHGHCRILKNNGRFDNRMTLEVLSKISTSHAQVGVNYVMLSDMTEGNVAHVKESFKKNEIFNVGIIPQIKYASEFYNIFRKETNTPKLKKPYQLNPNDAESALRFAELEIREGADGLIIKPTLMYLDIVFKLRKKIKKPIISFMPSGESLMVYNLISKNFYGNEIFEEIITCVLRSGVEKIISYLFKYYPNSHEEDE